MASTGQLRVTTVPAVPAMISVDGIERDQYGLNWIDLPAGSHRVCFGYVFGFREPPCQNVTMTDGAMTTLAGSYEQLGFIRATTSPSLPVVIWPALTWVNNYGAWFPAQAGQYDVCFGQMEDWKQPLCQSVTVVPGQTVNTTGTYAYEPGQPGPSGYSTLRVTTSPPVSSVIVVDSKARNPWGLDWMSVLPGRREVCFRPVAGYREPPCQVVDVPSNGTAQVVGTFAPLGWLRVTTSPAVGSNITVDGNVANRYGVWRQVEPGDHEVCFGAVAGYTAPTCRTVEVTAGATSATVGTFTPG